MNDRRSKLIQIGLNDMMGLFFKADYRYRHKALPDDVVYSNMGWEARTQSFLICVSHPSFDEVDDHDELPMIEGGEVIAVHPDIPAQDAIIGMLERLTITCKSNTGTVVREADAGEIRLTRSELYEMMKSIPGDRYERYISALVESK